MISKIKLLELMSAKMFHDLAGPVGAINNSLEFFEDNNPDIREKAIQIMKSSSDESISRLKFFRQAYGTVGSSKNDASSIHQLIIDFLANGKIQLDWKDPVTSPIDGYLIKAILNFVIIAHGAMIRGGTLEISFLENKISILYIGNNQIFSADYKALLEGDLNYITLTSANVQVYYTYMIITEAKAKLNMKFEKDKSEFVISF